MRLARYADPARLGFFGHSDIEGRYLYLDPATFDGRETVDELNDRFCRGALEIGEAAVRRALAAAGWTPDDLDFLTTTTCTGRLTPSLDAHLVGGSAAAAISSAPTSATPVARRRWWRCSRRGIIFRPFPITRRSCSRSRSARRRTTTTTAWKARWRTPSLPTGPAALALSATGPGPSLVAHRTLFRPEHLDAMGFEYPGGRPRVVLSKDVRRIGSSMMGEMAAVMMSVQGLKHEDIRYWILHSAGRHVIDRALTVLDLTEEQVAASRHVLRQYGNMSSATILFVLEETLRTAQPIPGEWGLMIGLGPGFAAEGALLRW